MPLEPGFRRHGLLVCWLPSWSRGHPSLIDFTRSFEFPVTAAAILTACTYALLASEALSRRGWSIVWGVLLGLLPLARTMTIAFVPAQLLAAGWLITSRPGERRPRAVNGSIALAAALVTTGTWFVNSWHVQLNYLTNFGYGSESANFSTSGSKLSVGYWTRELVNTVRADLYLPLAVLVSVAILLALAALAVRYRGRPTFGAWARHWISSDAAVVTLVVIEGYLAITSSRNEGVGFRVPLLPSLLALAVYALWRLPWQRARLWTAGALISVSVFNIAMKADAVRALSRRLSATVPGFGSVPVVDGTGWIQAYVVGALETDYVRATKPLPDSQRGWMPAYDAIDANILSLARRGHFTPNVELTTDEPLLNAYDLSFAGQLHTGQELAANVLPGPAGPATLAAYADAVRRAELAGVDVLVTVSQVGVSYFAPVQSPSTGQALFDEAAASLGFSCGAAVPLPDARRAFISWRPPASIVRRSSFSAQGCAPRIQRTMPAAGANGVSPTTRIVAVFSGPMDQASTSRAIVVARTSDAHPVAGKVAFFGDQAAVFTPTRPLPRRTTFTATVTSAARAAIGARLAPPYTWSFTTR